MVGTFVVGTATGAALVLLTAAAQESVPEHALGRVMATIFLVDVGAKPFGSSQSRRSTRCSTSG